MFQTYISPVRNLSSCHMWMILVLLFLLLLTAPMFASFNACTESCPTGLKTLIFPSQFPKQILFTGAHPKTNPLDVPPPSPSTVPSSTPPKLSNGHDTGSKTTTPLTSTLPKDSPSPNMPGSRSGDYPTWEKASTRALPGTSLKSL